MAVGGILRARPRKKSERKPKPTCVFEWFAGTLSVRSGSHVLELARGCDRTTITYEGDDRVEARARDSEKRLLVNIGDCLILFGSSVAETGGVKVVRIEQDGYRERLIVQWAEPEHAFAGRVHALKTKARAA